MKISKYLLAFATLSLSLGSLQATFANETPKQDDAFNECIEQVIAECANFGGVETKNSQDFNEILNCIMENIANCM